ETGADESERQRADEDGAQPAARPPGRSILSLLVRLNHVEFRVLPPAAILEPFGAMWSPVWPSVDVVKRGQKRAPRSPGGDGGDGNRLDRQHQIARRPQREGAEQGRELVADRRAGEPACDRFREAKG